MDTLVTVKELANELGLDRSTLRRFIKKNGFNTVKTRTPESQNQLTLALSLEDAEAVRELRQSQGYTLNVGKRIASNGIGYFYIIQVIPEFDPNRIKLGYTENIQGRLNAHKTAAPTAKILEKWPARKHWESTAIDSITRISCKNIAGEVYECINLAALIDRANQFFALMPGLETQNNSTNT